MKCNFYYNSKTEEKIIASMEEPHVGSAADWTMN